MLCASQVDLPPLLGVDITHCERQAARAVQQSQGDMQLLQGEIFTQQYFTNIASDIDELLQVKSQPCYARCMFEISYHIVDYQGFPEPDS